MNYVFRALSLGAVYLAMLGRVTPADVVFGFALGLVQGLLRPSQANASNRVLLRRSLAMPQFYFAIAIEMLRGSFEVLAVLIGRKDWRKAGLVEAPRGERTHAGMETTGLVVTSIPGSILVDVDEEQQIMLFSVVDASNPDQLRRDWDRFYQRYQKQVEP